MAQPKEEGKLRWGGGLVNYFGSALLFFGLLRNIWEAHLVQDVHFVALPHVEQVPTC
jgi:hypothetical protein